MGASKKLFVDEAGAAWTLGRIAGIVVIAGLVAGIVSCALRVARRRQPDLDAARRALLLVWLAGIWLSYATSAKDHVQPHYLIASFPVSFALVGLGLATPSRWRAAARAAADRGGGRRRLRLRGVRRLHPLVPPLPRPPRRHRRRLRRRLPRRAGPGRAPRHRQGLNVADETTRVPRHRLAHPPPGHDRLRHGPVNRLRPARPLHCAGRLRTSARSRPASRGRPRVSRNSLPDRHVGDAADLAARAAVGGAGLVRPHDGKRGSAGGHGARDRGSRARCGALRCRVLSARGRDEDGALPERAR